MPIGAQVLCNCAGIAAARLVIHPFVSAVTRALRRASIAIAVLLRNIVFRTLVDANLSLSIRRFLDARDGLRFQRLPFLDELFHTLRVRVRYFRESLEIS